MSDESKWMVEAQNRKGTAHYWYSISKAGLCIAYCGRQQLLLGLQPESEALRKCTRCEKSANRFSR